MWVIVWSVAGLVALVTGIMWGASSSVDFSLVLIAMKAFPVLILGGFTSVPGVIVGGLIFGVGEKVAELYWGDALGGSIEEWFAYVLALVFLMFRPQGLFGEKIIERVADARIPTKYGEMNAVSYRSLVDTDEHVALVKGNINSDAPVLVRVHSECLTGDVFGSLRCDCGEQMQMSIQMIGEEQGSGVFLYMRQEGRGIGIHNKLKAYNLQDQGLDTVDANVELGFAPDLRHYGVGAQILVDLGVRKIRLLTNNPKKVVGLESFGLDIVERIPILSNPNDENKNYLDTKRDRLGHILD